MFIDHRVDGEGLRSLRDELTTYDLVWLGWGLGV